MAEVKLPQLGETVTEGTITQWFKTVGDSVAADEPLFEVSTDKVDTEVPSPVAGTLTEIRVPEGETVDVGTVIAVVGDASATTDAPTAPASESAAPTAAPAAPAATAPPAPTSAAVEPDSPVPAQQTAAAEAQSEAAANEPAAAESQLQATTAPAPSAPPAAPAPQPQATAPAPSAPPAAPAPQPQETAPAPSAPPAAPAPQPQEATAPAPAPAPSTPPSAPSAAPASPAVTNGAAGKLLSPVVRRLVAEHGLDPGAITGTGPGGRITRDDVLDHIDTIASGRAAAAPTSAPAPAAAGPSAPAPIQPPDAAAAPAAQAAAAPPSAPATATSPPPAAGPAVAAGERDQSVPLAKIRRLTGAAMIASKATSPHAFSVVEVDYHNVDRARSKVKEGWKSSEGFSLTYLPFIARAVIDAIDDFPHMNASVGANELVVHGYVDLGIAVDLDYSGLIVPVVRAAESKRLAAIAKEIHDLATRARNKKLLPDEISGGTFTISNNGSAGSVLTFPIINQPQVAILSTDAIVRKPVVAALPDGTEAVVVHPVGNLAMAWDHRAFDGAYAAGFLVRVKELLETKDWSAEL